MWPDLTAKCSTKKASHLELSCVLWELPVVAEPTYLGLECKQCQSQGHNLWKSDTKQFIKLQFSIKIIFTRATSATTMTKGFLVTI